jgi:hypothetical protein
MVDRPILFSGPMIRALLEGRKTVTRRTLKPQPEPWRGIHLEGGCQQSDWRFETGTMTNDGKRHRFGLWMHSGFHESQFHPLPYAPGDRLWVRETCAHWMANDGSRVVAYKADFTGDGRPNAIYRPSIFMPRWASRTTLTVTGVKVERLHDISEEEAMAEGISSDQMIVETNGNGGRHNEVWGERFFTGLPDQDEENFDSPIDAYARLWNRINGKRPGCRWEDNPWVSAISFTVHHCNIDAMPKEPSND